MITNCLYLCCLLCVVGCELQRGTNTAGNVNMNELLITIADPQIDEETLADAIQALGTVDEDAQFWADITNSSQYSQQHRRRAVFALFQRHIYPPITLGELADILDNPSWIKSEDIGVVGELAGEIPVIYNPEDTVFVLPIFPEVPDGHYAFWAIYLRVEGKIAAETLGNILYGRSSDEQLLNKHVLEFALSPDEPANVDW